MALLCACAAAQTAPPANAGVPAANPGQQSQQIDVTKLLAAQLAPPNSSPERVVATVEGMKITAGELHQFYSGLPSNVQFYYGQNRKEFVERYALVRKLAAAATAAKLDQQTPYKQQLETARINILMQAQVDSLSNKELVSDEEQQAYYKEHPDEFTHARISGIFVAAATEDAKAKAAAMVQKLRGGEDFAKFAKENSEDKPSAERSGDLGYLAKNGNYPPAAMKIIFALKPGEISEPVELETGQWVFRMEEIHTKDYDSVKDDIFQNLKQKALVAWMDKVRKSISVKVEDEAYFKVAQPSPDGTVTIPLTKQD